MTLLSFADDYWASWAAFFGFGLLHSICAQEPFKDGLARLTGSFFVEHFWRILYCVFSYFWLYNGIAYLHWAQNAEKNVWIVLYPEWLWQFLIVLHLFSIAFLYLAFLQCDYLEFLGLNQAGRGIRTLLGRPPVRPRLELFGTDRLEVTGVYGWVRHPMLIGGFIFILTSGPSLNNIVYAVMYAAYMVIGGYYEERRLVKVFGEAYLDYRRKAGAFFPRLGRGPAG